MKALASHEPACAETLECRYWDEANTIWSTDGCVTKVYNGTDGGAFTGCECSHLSEFVSITVPTDAYGDVQFGSIDVASGNLTHVRGEQGGMWLAVHKESTRLPVTTAMAYLAYADEARTLTLTLTLTIKRLSLTLTPTPTLTLALALALALALTRRARRARGRSSASRARRGRRRPMAP